MDLVDTRMERSDQRIKEKLIDAIAGTVQTIVRYGCVLGVAYFAYLSIKSLAGKVTLADIQACFQFSQSDGDVKAVKVGSYIKIFLAFILPWFLAIIAIGYGKNQKKLRGNAIQRLNGRIREFESSFDKNRSSSALSERGDTNESDN